MTIENIGGFMQSGNLEQILDRGKSIASPQVPLHGKTSQETAESFSEIVQNSLDKLNEIQVQADQAARELTAGKNKNIHETMLLLEKADMSFRMAMQVRNKILDAYREVMRMQV